MKRTVIACAAVLCTAAHAQTFQGFPPAVPPLSGNEQLPADTGASPPSELIQLNQIAQFSNGFDAGQNWLIAGDATQNLWQRGTTGPTTVGPVVFGPDRWAYWSGAGTPMTVSQDVTAGHTFPGFGAAYKVQRLSGATGVSQLCLTQELSSLNSQVLQGKVVSIDFDVFGGANVSAAVVKIYLVIGTGANEGVTKLAYGVNGGGGGSVGWTGQSNVVATTFAPINSGFISQPAVVARLPINETEVGVVICYTPTGTAGADDSMSFSGIQLRQAAVLAPYLAYGIAFVAPTLPTPSFAWRLGNQEALLQYAYYEQLTEGVGPDPVGTGCVVSTVTTRADCDVRFIVPMNRIPDMGYVTGFATTANAGGLVACTGLATSPGYVITYKDAVVGCTTGTNVKAASFLFENGGAGIISANAEWN